MTSPAAHAGAVPAATRSFVSFTSEPREWVGGGGHLTWIDRFNGDRIRLSGSVNSTVEVDVGGADLSRFYTFQFAAAPGAVLSTGYYPKAQRVIVRAAGRPGLDIYGAVATRSPESSPSATSRRT